MKKQKRSGWRYPITTYSFSLFAILVMLSVVCPPLARSLSHLSYIIVLDCGSSGTRIAAYSVRANATSPLPILSLIPPEAAAQKLPRKVVKSAYNRVETHPGLDTAAARGRAGVKEALGPLLTWAQAAIPASAHASTPVMLFATAGVRRMNLPEQEELMQHVRAELHASPFRFEPSWAGTMTGKWEGIFGWIALNYHHGRFQQSHNTHSQLLHGPPSRSHTTDPSLPPNTSAHSAFDQTSPGSPRHQRALHADAAAPHAHQLESVRTRTPLNAASQISRFAAIHTRLHRALSSVKHLAAIGVEHIEPGSRSSQSPGSERDAASRHTRHVLSDAPANEVSAPTLGALDMGGSSLEITMEMPMDGATAEPARWPPQRVPPLPVTHDSAALPSSAGSEPDVEDISLPGLRTFRVYSRTMEHMGLNAAFDRAVALLLLETLATHPGSAVNARRRALLHKETRLTRSQNLHTNMLTSGSVRVHANGNTTSTRLRSILHVDLTQHVARTGVRSAIALRGEDGVSGAAVAGASRVTSRRLEQAAMGGEIQDAKQVDLHDRNVVLGHPCLPGGFRQRFSGPLGPAESSGVHGITLEGRPDSDGCGSLVRRLIASPNVTCPSVNACSIVRPPTTAGVRFVALSGFFVVFKYFGLLDKGATVRELMEAARQHCEDSFSNIVAANPGETFPETYCFRAHLVNELLQTWELEPEQVDVEGGSVSWTLGAALHHASHIMQGEARIREEALDEPQLQRWLSVMSIAALCACIFFLFYEARLFATGLSYLPLSAHGPTDSLPETPVSPEVEPQSWPDKSRPSQDKSIPRPASVSCLQARVVSWCDSVSPKYISRLH